MEAKTLRELRNTLLENATRLVNLAEQDGRELKAEERQEVNGAIERAKNIDADLARMDELSQLVKQPNRPATLGMSDQEIQSYSITRALKAAADPKQDWSNAGLEAEASAATARMLGKEPQGFYVPYDYLNRRASLVTTAGSTGGDLMATNLVSFIDALRNRMVVIQAGAQVMSGLVGNVAIPSLVTPGTASWVAEDSAGGSPSLQRFDQVELKPKTVTSYTDISHRTLMNSTPAMDGIITNDLIKILSIALDKAALHGTGADNQPTGIASVTGIGAVTGGSAGAAPTWANIVALEQEVAVDNADFGALAYITNPKVRGKLKATQKTATYGDIMVWGDGPNPLNGYPAYVTSQVRSDITKTTSNLSAIFFGNWNELLIGLWGGLDILVDPYSLSSQKAVRIVASQDADIAVRHAESFSAMLDAITS